MNFKRFSINRVSLWYAPAIEYRPWQTNLGQLHLLSRGVSDKLHATGILRSIYKLFDHRSTGNVHYHNLCLSSQMLLKATKNDLSHIVVIDYSTQNDMKRYKAHFANWNGSQSEKNQKTVCATSIFVGVSQAHFPARIPTLGVWARSVFCLSPTGTFTAGVHFQKSFRNSQFGVSHFSSTFSTSNQCGRSGRKGRHTWNTLCGPLWCAVSDLSNLDFMVTFSWNLEITIFQIFIMKKEGLLLSWGPLLLTDSRSGADVCTGIKFRKFVFLKIGKRK